MDLYILVPYQQMCSSHIANNLLFKFRIYVQYSLNTEYLKYSNKVSSSWAAQWRSG